MWIFPCICIAGHYHTWATGILLVLVWSGPSLPRLTMLLSSVDWDFYRCLHYLTTVTFRPGCPSFGCLAWDLLGPGNYYMHGWWATQICIYFNHIRLYICEGQTDSLLVNPSVWNRNELATILPLQFRRISSGMPISTCSRSRRRAAKADKRMVLVHTHGLFIT
jgi:hypothetical protein